MINICPRCSNNNWSNFQTGNEQNKTLFFYKFCNICHKYSFEYHCSPNLSEINIDSISISTNEFTIIINYTQNTTKILNSSATYICELNSSLNIAPNTPDEQLNSKIKTLIMFS